MKKNLLEIDLQLFADEVEDAGENEVAETAEPQEDETSEAESTETSETEEGSAEPTEQSAEENARYAAIRRKAEEDARRKYDPVVNQLTKMNQEAAAMCEGVTHPVTGKPITNVFEYWDALRAQQQQSTEEELQSKGVDPALIKRLVASDPTVIQANQVMRQMQDAQATLQVQRDIEEIKKLDPSIKGAEDLQPYSQELVEYCQAHNTTLADAYKVLLWQPGKSARQQAINEMRGKSHLPGASSGVATDNDDVEVPSDIMASWKAEGKTEKQIKELYRTVAKKLHLN